MDHLELRIHRQKEGRSVRWVEELRVNGAVVASGFAWDYLALARSTASGGDYWLMVCGCGEPGCAGLVDPVRVENDDEVISWHIVAPSPERRFRFSAAQYRSAIFGGLQRANALVMKEPAEEIFRHSQNPWKG